MRDVVRYNEALKLRLAEEAASGKYRSLDEAGRRNGIRGCATLGRRIKQYGRADALPKRIKVETMTEIDELREARGRIRELEAALANARFFEVLKEKGLLPGRLPGAPRAADSRHSLPVFHNLVKDMALAGPSQARAADITYIRTR